AARSDTADDVGDANTRTFAGPLPRKRFNPTKRRPIPIIPAMTSRPSTRLLRGEERLPFGLRPAERQAEPIRGRERPSRETEPRLVHRSVLLVLVAPATRRHDVLPDVLPARGLRDDVVDVLGGVAAVLARPVISREH